MRNRKSAVLLGLVGMSLLFAGRVAAAPELDQQQRVLDETRAVVVGGSGPQVPAQVVRSGIPGLLAQVDLPVACETPSTELVVRILDAGAGPSPGQQRARDEDPDRYLRRAGVEAGRVAVSALHPRRDAVRNRAFLARVLPGLRRPVPGQPISARGRLVPG